MYICNNDLTFKYLLSMMIVKKQKCSLNYCQDIVGKQMKTETLQITIKKIILTICLPVMEGNKKKKQTHVILKFTRQPGGQ